MHKKTGPCQDDTHTRMLPCPSASPPTWAYVIELAQHGMLNDINHHLPAQDAAALAHHRRLRQPSAAVARILYRHKAEHYHQMEALHNVLGCMGGMWGRGGGVAWQRVCVVHG